MRSAVLDTNVLASGALTPHTIPGQILNGWRNNQFELVLSQYILKELYSTLNKPYFLNLINMQDIEDFLDLLQNEATIVSITTPIPKIATHPEDDIVLATAESGNAQYIITGDHGLQNIKEFKGIQIVNPRHFAGILQIEEVEK